jgi:hypothetical protein
MTSPLPTNPVFAGERSQQALRVLKLAFVIIPVVAGLDKFTDLLGNWDLYVTPGIPAFLGISAHTFMQLAGIVEISVGIGVALRPSMFSYIVSAWMTLSFLALMLEGGYYDIALKDLGLAFGAYALGRLSGESKRELTQMASPHPTY